MLLALLGACHGEDPQVPCIALGDPQKPMQLEVGQLRLKLEPADDPTQDRITAADFVPLHEGDDIDLYLPPQGGHVSFLGARVTNVMSCSLTLRSSIHEIDSGDLVQYEERTTKLAPIEGMAGWGELDRYDLSAWANVPLCPDYFAKDVVDQPYALEVKVTDRDGRSEKVRVGRVTPRCNEGDPRRQALCDCECRGSYVLGRCASFDAGVTDGATWDSH